MTVCVRNDFIPEFDKADVIKLPLCMLYPFQQKSNLLLHFSPMLQTVELWPPSPDQGFNLKTFAEKRGEQ